MTRCENCNYEFTNIMLRRNCPRCNQLLKKIPVDSSSSSINSNRTDDGFDSAGFAIGMATGVPLSPTHGISTGSLLGAALHSKPSPTPAEEATPSPSPTPSCDSSSDSSSSYSSDSSSSSSDSSSGSCGGGGGE